MVELIPDEFIALDIETTGLDPSRDEIIELGCVLFSSGKPVQTFTSLIHTKRALSSFIIGLTGITQKDVEGGKDLGDTLKEFINFIGDRPLVAHNSGFDLAFIQAKLKTKKIQEIRNPVYDSLLISRLSLPGQNNYKLETLKESLGLCEGRSHRAEADALACGRLFVISLTTLSEMPEVKRSSLSRLVKSRSTDTLRLLCVAVPEQEKPVKRKKPEPLPQPLVEPEKANEVDLKEMGGVFDIGGVLSEKLDGYEFRKGQLEMAQAVCSALNNKELLAVEAGTGTGKSLAYLAASVRYASINNVRVIISTRTKALQDQIFKKEIPFLRETLGWEFRASILKGRSNYLCLRKWEDTLNASAMLLRGWEADALLPLVPWAETTDSGDISECLAFNEKENRILWTRISSDAETCRGSRCSYFHECFLMRKRREAQSSQIVLVNHSLFFTDLKGDGALLGKTSRVIFDEAHALEDIGRKHLGDEITHLMFSVTLQKLYKGDEGGRGLLRYLELLLMKEKGDAAFGRINTLTALARDVSSAEHDSVRFFRSLGSQLKKEKQVDKLRYTDTLASVIEFKEPVPEIEALVAKLASFIDSMALEYDDVPEIKSLIIDIRGVLRELEGRVIVLDKLLQANNPLFVFWAEGSSNPLNVKLIGVPLEIRNIFKSNFLDTALAVVFTSATLAIRNNLDYFCNRLGLTGDIEGRIVKQIIPSPYCFKQQLHCALVSDTLPIDNASFVAETADTVFALSSLLNKRMLLLFTSREMLKNVYESLSPRFAGINRPLFAQDINGSGWQLLEEMRKNPGAVLLGTDSFWEGVDLPGDHLEILFLLRLPFSVPTDPVVEARARACEEKDENAFHSFYMPEAIIKFRQGVGRLIRRHDDRGVLIILDRRIMDKPYGKVFLNSIEADKAVYANRDALLSGVQAFFGEGA